MGITWNWMGIYLELNVDLLGMEWGLLGFEWEFTWNWMGIYLELNGDLMGFNGDLIGIEWGFNGIYIYTYI